jgi:uncharacterized repeat protein (TIGR03803 family)
MGQTYTVLHSFAGGSNDGANPYGSFVQSGSILYGMTSTGGKYGTVFGFDTVTNQLTVLYSFQGFEDGSGTFGSPTQAGPLLYGLCAAGADYGGSVLFSYNTSTNTHTVLYDFNSDGAVSYGTLLQSGSMLYGLANHANNGSPFGTLFAFNTADNTETTLHSFTGNGSDGAYPDYGSLVQSGSVLYGTTGSGGLYGAGTILSFDTNTNTESILHSFFASASSSPSEPEGAFPQGSVIKSGNLLFGLASGGGSNGAGTLYAFDLTTDTLTVLHAFGAGVNDGAMP